MMHLAYRAATDLVAPILPVYAVHRRRRGLEDPDRLPERRGIAGAPRPDGPLLWFHGASIGETASVLPLIERLIAMRPDAAVLATSVTRTAATVLARRLPSGAIHQYYPMDRAAWVRRFLGHWRPDLAFWLESELWPNMLCELRAQGVPAALLNARMSPTSFRRWRRFPRFARRLLGSFELTLAQDAEHAARFRVLGAEPVLIPGNLKYAAPPLAADETALEAVLDAVADRPVWLAASTHPGEEAHVVHVHEALRHSHAGVLTLLAPRHPERGDEIEALLSAKNGLAVARRSRGELPGAATGVYLIDTLDELGLFYRVAEAVFIGGSLVPHGGQNPLEPARLGVALVHGPAMFNFTEIAAELAVAGGTRQVADRDELAAAIGLLLSDGEVRRTQAARAAAVADARSGVLDEVLGALSPLLARI